MTQILYWLTTLVNLVGLAVSLCLSLYIVTRTPQSRLSWLAALTLWSLSCFYLYNALAATLPGSGVLPLIRPWEVLALALGFHLVLLLPPQRHRERIDFFLPRLRLPDAIRQRLGGAASPVSRAAVLIAYGLALLLIVGGVFPPALPAKTGGDPAIYLSDRTTSPLYPLATVFLVVLGFMAFLHLGTGWRRERGRRQKRHYLALFAAVALTSLGGLYLTLGVWLQLDIPSLPADLAVGTAVVIVGYLVAEYNAYVEGLDIKRDLLYIALAITLFTVSYVIVAELLYLRGHVFSALTLILIILFAVTSLMLYDGLRAALDRLFYREQFRQLRANLRALAREAGVGQALPDRLYAILAALCRTLRITRGFIALRSDDSFYCEATVRAEPLGEKFPKTALASAEIAELPRPGSSSPEGMALLVPIYAGDDQIGGLVLGRTETGRSYSEEDLMLLDDVAEQLAIVIQTSQLQEENARAISGMVEDFRERERALQRRMQQLLAEREHAQPVMEGVDEEEFTSMVEDALRRLHDYSYLGEQPLAQLRVVAWRMETNKGGFVTHIDRGKALSDILTQAVQKLRPEGEAPDRHAVPGREWYQYIVLHDAYVLGELNRDIMSRLYISEGTFNRTRRRAVRSVSKALPEMEQEARQRTTT